MLAAVFDSRLRPWILAGIAATFALIWRFTGNRFAESLWLQRHWLYEILTLTTGITLLSGVRLFRKANVHRQLIRRKWELGAVLTATLSVATVWGAHEPAQWRICQDDQQHVATAMVIYQTGQVGIPHTTLGEGDEMEIASTGPVFRGTQYAYLLSLFHDFFGYDIRHAYSLNMTLGMTSLCLAYLLGRDLGGGRLGAWTCFMLTASVPLLGQLARSAGYDLLNSVLILAYALALRRLWKNPETAEASFAAALGVTLALTRAESIIYLGAYAITVLALVKERRLPAPPLAIPTLMPGLIAALSTQIILLNLYSKVSDSFNTTGKANWSVENLLTHGEDAIAFAFAPDAASAGSSLLAWCGTGLIMIVFAAIATRRIRIDYDHLLFLFFAITSLVFYALTLGTFWGGPSQAEMARFTMPLWIIAGWATALAIREIPKTKLSAPWILIPISAYGLLFTLPSIKAHRLTNKMQSASIYNAMSRLSDRMKTCGTMHVANASLTFAVNRMSSTTWFAAAQSPERLALAKRYGVIERIYLYDARATAPQIDAMIGSTCNRADLSRCKLRRIGEEPIERLPTAKALCYEVEGIKNAKGEWVMFDGPRIDLPVFESTAEYKRFIASLLP